MEFRGVHLSVEAVEGSNHGVRAGAGEATRRPQAEESPLLLVAQQAEQATLRWVVFALQAWRSDQPARASFAPVGNC